MTEWISIEDKLPKEAPDRWVHIKQGYREPKYKCKVWESEDGSISFVNILFQKEEGVTHWREAG